MSDLAWYRLRWPREVSGEHVASVMRLLSAGGGMPVVLEAIGQRGVVSHFIGVPSDRAGTLMRQARAAITGLTTEYERARRTPSFGRSIELRLSSRLRPLRTNDPVSVSRAMLNALAHVGRDEAIGVQWVLARPLPPLAVPQHVDGWVSETWLKALVMAPFGGVRPMDTEARGALKAKQAEPGWQAVGRIAARAASPTRERQLIGQLLGALRSVENPSVGWRMRSARPARFSAAQAGWLPPLKLNSLEVAALSSWPVGLCGELPVSVVGSRVVAPSSAIARSGTVVAESTFPGAQRPLALRPNDLRRHLHVLGPSGVGKSTLLLNVITQQMRAGRSLVVLDPKGDLIADVMRRVPPERMADVVVVDPADSEFVVGINPLASGGRSPELVADQLLHLFHSLYASYWGPRTQDILGASLLTLARMPDVTLVALPLLLTDASFRRRVVAQVADPLGLAPFWSTFEAWSDAERLAAIAPTLNRLRPLLMRPELRAIIGQAQPRFTLSQVFTERKVLLVNLARGLLGPETSSLLGSLIVSQLWQAILGRAAVAPERRHPVPIVLDEFQTILHLPVDIADALAQARGMGCPFVLAHQHMHQLDPAMRSALLANAQSKVAFRLPSEDARVLATGSASLSADDFMSLGAFGCYTQLVARDAVQPWCSARTLSASKPSSDPDAVRVASRAAYARPRAEVEAELQQLLVRKPDRHDDLGPQRRGERS